MRRVLDLTAVAPPYAAPPRLLYRLHLIAQERDLSGLVSGSGYVIREACLSMYVSVCLSVRDFRSACLSVSLSLCLCVSLSVCLSLSLSLSVSVPVSVCRSVCLSLFV